MNDTMVAERPENRQDAARSEGQAQARQPQRAVNSRR